MSLIRENRTAGEAVGKGRRKKEESKSESWQTTKKGQRSTQHSRSEGAQRQLSGQCVVVEAVVGVVEVVVVVEELGARAKRTRPSGIRSDASASCTRPSLALVGAVGEGVEGSPGASGVY